MANDPSTEGDKRIFRERAKEMGMADALVENFLLPLRGNEAFGGGAPLEALREGRLLEVIEAAEAFTAGRDSETPRCNCASHGLTAEYRHGLRCPYGVYVRRRSQKAARV